MAAPVAVVRQMPSGYKMPDGYQSEITFQNQPAVQLWEKQIKPPGVDGGEKIDTSTLLNTAWRTASPRHLKTLSDMSCQFAYDPDVLPVIYGLINQEQSITVLFPDGSTLAFWGFLQKFEPGELKEGEFPMAAGTVAVTNWDPTNRVEAGPVFSAGSL